jgi:hypothetical protein
MLACKVYKRGKKVSHPIYDEAGCWMTHGTYVFRAVDTTR